MCVVVAPVVAWTIAAVTAAAAVAQDVSANKAAKKQTKILQDQADERAEQLADQASAEMNARASELRKATASARASASGAGINLGSGSFLAQLQSFDEQLDEAQGLQTKNLNDSVKANSTALNVSLSQITTKTGLGMGIDAVQAGVSSYSAMGGSFAKKPPSSTT
ncbi:TPA: hypothetical protein ACKQCJ_000370 [Stenotrophomonas maltophilia]|nr:hypothetical protein [Stenotrophomonas maltophilia]